jgi:hypothetical protein
LDFHINCLFPRVCFTSSFRDIAQFNAVARLESSFFCAFRFWKIGSFNQAEQTGKLFPVSRFDDEIVGNSEAGQAAKRLKKRLT